MKSFSLFLLALANHAAAGAITRTTSTVPAHKTSSADRGTWTYTTTLTEEVTSTVTATGTHAPVTETNESVASNTNTKTVTKSTGLTNYAATKTVAATQTLKGTTIYVDATSKPTASIVSVSSPAGFTPILSEFAYTASVEVDTITTTYYSFSTIDPAPTVTVTKVSTVPPKTITKTTTTTTVSVPATKTVTKTTVVQSPVTVTRSSFPTHHAICEENSGNYVNHYPYGAQFEALTYDGDDNNDADGSVHPLDRSGVYFNKTLAFQDKKDCCNYANSNDLVAFGYWEPQGPNGPNVCYIFNVRDQSVCTPSEVKYSLNAVDNVNPDTRPSEYFAFNGKCGRVTPDRHSFGFYQAGGVFTPP